MSEETKELTRVHRAGNVQNKQQCCKHCGIVLINNRGLRPFANYFEEDSDIELVQLTGEWAAGRVHDHNKSPLAVRCTQDFAPPDLAEELHGSADDPDQMKRLKVMLSDLADKLAKDKEKDLAGHYRYEVSVSVAKYKRDSGDPSGWRRVW